MGDYPVGGITLNIDDSIGFLNDYISKHRAFPLGGVGLPGVIIEALVQRSEVQGSLVID